MKRLLAIGLLICASSVQAEPPALFQDWVTFNYGDSSEIRTENADGAAIGTFCTADSCSTYFEPGSKCEDKSTYVALMNAPDGANAVGLTCLVTVISGKTRYLEILKDGIELEFFKAFQKGGTVGIVVPKQNGLFLVARFSALDYANAVSAMKVTPTTARAKGGAAKPGNELL